MVRLIVNGVERQVDADPDMPLLWALRDVIHRNFNSQARPRRALTA